LLEFGDIDSIVQQTRIEALLKKPADPNNPQATDQMGLAMTENEMLLEGKEMPVSELDDHMVHIAMHQEALGQGMDDIVGTHIAKHQLYLQKGIGAQAPVNPGATGYDQGDQSRLAQAVQPVQPVNAENLQVPVPPGTPPGQQLPQQNVQQAMSQIEAEAGQSMGGM
jgi:hypothetical protein